MIEDAAAHVVPAPADRVHVGIVVVAAAEGLEPVAAGVEEVDRHAVARRPDVDRHPVDAHDVGGAQHALPTGHLERDVVQLGVLGVAHHGDVVRLGAAGQPGGQIGLAVFELDAFDQREAQHLGEQLQVAVDVAAVDQAVVQPDRAQPLFLPGHHLGAGFAKNPGAHGNDQSRFFQDADDVAKSPTQTDAAPGLFKYQDVNGDGKIDADDRTYIGDPNPDFTYGFNISFNYKSFDFSAFFFGSKGNDIFNQTRYFTDFPDFFKGGIRREAAVNSWTPDNPNGTVPKLQLAGGFSSDQVTNSYFISKGSYFRSKQMQIGYSLPNNLLTRFGIDRLRIYVQAANLFTITNYDGLDPELQSSDINATVGYGIDQGNYPHTPSYLFGVNLNF